MNKHAKKNDLDKFNATMEIASISTLSALLCRVAPNVYNILHWMANHVRHVEKVEVAWWEGPRFYVSVKDTRNLPEYRGVDAPGRYRIGLTVDIDEDQILWNHEGGNCFVRDPRWKALFDKRYPHRSWGTSIEAQSIHVYKPHRLPKEQPPEILLQAWRAWGIPGGPEA